MKRNAWESVLKSPRREKILFTKSKIPLVS